MRPGPPPLYSYYPVYYPMPVYGVYGPYYYPVRPGCSQQSVVVKPQSSGGAVAAQASVRLVPRTELLVGKTAADWPALYHAGYTQFWAGRYEQSLECCAAAIELGDEPRSWFYLALALHATGQQQTAWEVARYAAAAVTLNPSTRDKVNEASSRVQGPIRDQLTQIQREVGDTQAARSALAYRPTFSVSANGDGGTKVGLREQTAIELPVSRSGLDSPVLSESRR